MHTGMRKIVYLTILIVTSIFASCSKIDMNDKFFVDSRWSGTIINSNVPSDEFDAVSMKFFKGYFKFVHLEYATNNPEEGTALYEVSGNTFTVSKANELMDGTWTIVEKKSSTIQMERSHDSGTLTMLLTRFY